MTVLYVLMSVLLAGVIAAPLSLSAQSIIDWAAGSHGLGLGENSNWKYVPFGALDAAGATCVLMVLICAWKGESPGVFRILVWVFTTATATANYNEGTSDAAPGEATWWFMPLMSILGPILLEVILMKVKAWVRRADGRRLESPPGMGDYGWSRWMPGIGAFTETFGSWRLARLVGISQVDLSIDLYRQLMPHGGFRVARAWRTAQLVHTDQERTVRTSIKVERVYLNAPVQDVRTPERVQVPVRTGRDVQVRTPERSTSTPVRTTGWVVDRRAEADAKRLEKIRAEFGTEIPTKSKIRTLLGTNNEIAGRLLGQLQSGS